MTAALPRVAHRAVRLAAPALGLPRAGRERPRTSHTRRRAAEIAASRALAGGMDRDDPGTRAAPHVPPDT